MLVTVLRPLRPKAVALSSLRAPGISPNAPWSRSYGKKKFNTKRMKRIREASEGEELNHFKDRSIKAHLQAYAMDASDKIATAVGKVSREFLFRQKPLIAQFGIKRPNLTTITKTMSKYENFTRLLKVFRIWLLDLQSVNDIAFIVEYTNQELDGGIPARIGLQLRTIMARIQEVPSPRHVDEIEIQRERLLGIAQVLRQVEKRYRLPYDDIEGGDFPSYRLRRVEENLMEAEVLSKELTVRKALLATPILERNILTKLKQLGFTSDFKPLPGGEPDLD
ncbi:hypothetical protein GGR51DRAFT_390258 [Nemania sp. FL0031]|nr:hypothetical protein GGR51DRAFT_390258 [Nemania sp. FL0031]